MLDEFKKFKHAKKDSAVLINFWNSITMRFMIFVKNAKLLIKALLPEDKAEDIRDVPIPHFKPIPIPPFRADTDTTDTTDTFLSIEHHQ